MTYFFHYSLETCLFRLRINILIFNFLYTIGCSLEHGDCIENVRVFFQIFEVEHVCFLEKDVTKSVYIPFLIVFST